MRKENKKKIDKLKTKAKTILAKEIMEKTKSKSSVLGR